MIFEFDDFVLVVEVTLLTTSRQEGAEGEPVRRHVADIAEQHTTKNKEVYGLFVALEINSNTAETFKIGNWYKSDDTKIPLQIVPVRLDDFSKLFKTYFSTGKLTPKDIRHFIINCRAYSNYDAPEWKKLISQTVNKMILTVNNSTN